ncbi:protein ripply2.2-like [Rhinophrynus dorsalis]
MEQTLAKGTVGRPHDLLPSLTLDCYSCKCLRSWHRSVPEGCISEPSGAIRTRPHRPHVMFWRPWLLKNSKQKTQNLPYADSLCENPQYHQKPAEYNHPVRLFWPISKSMSHMYQEAADLLRNFPVQATISFYNDSESDTDNEEENSEEEEDSGFESE